MVMMPVQQCQQSYEYSWMSVKVQLFITRHRSREVTADSHPFISAACFALMGG